MVYSMNPYGETRSFTGACVSTTWREDGGILCYRSSTLLISQVEWEENGLRGKKKTPLEAVLLQYHSIFLSPFKADGTFKAVYT